MMLQGIIITFLICIESPQIHRKFLSYKSADKLFHTHASSSYSAPAAAFISALHIFSV